MTLEDAISHCCEVEEKPQTCSACAKEHAQLAEWPEELNCYRLERADAIEARHIFDRVRS